MDDLIKTHKLEMAMMDKQLKSMEYFSKIPNMDELNKVEGYETGKHLGVNSSAFLKTLNALNHFMEPVKLAQQDMEIKFAQIMILGSSLLSRPSFTSVEQSIKVANNKIY